MPIHIKPFLLLATMMMALQIPTGSPVPVVLSPDWFNTAEHLTLTSALIIAVAVLWKSNNAKDQLLIQSTKTVTEALAASAASNSELRNVIKDSVDAKITLSASIGSLQRSVEKLDASRIGELEKGTRSIR